MALGEDISNVEAGGYLILGFVVLGVLVYIVYEAQQLGESVKTSFCTFFGGDPASCAASGSSTGNTYTNAVSQSVWHPITTLETILGLNQTDSSAPVGSGVDTAPAPTYDTQTENDLSQAGLG